MAKAQSTATDVFVKTWEQCDSVAAVAEKLGTTKGSASARASKLRHDGVNLKTMPKGAGGGKKLDVEALNALLAELRGVKADDVAADESPEAPAEGVAEAPTEGADTPAE